VIREPELDPPELFGLRCQPGAGLGLAQPEDAAQLLDRNVVVDQLADLRQRHAEVAQNQDAVQAKNLLGGVVPVSADATEESSPAAGPR
jgi:hypothetical protein